VTIELGSSGQCPFSLFLFCLTLSLSPFIHLSGSTTVHNTLQEWHKSLMKEIHEDAR
jgi:hypothetical protein